MLELLYSPITCDFSGSAVVSTAPVGVPPTESVKSVVNSFYHQSFLIDHFCILQVPKHQILTSTITFSLL
jgi:hypothetical protein